MKFFDLTKALLEKVEECPNCKGKLHQESKHKIECETCGFRFYTTSKYREDISSLLGIIAITGLVALIIGIEWGKWLIKYGPK